MKKRFFVVLALVALLFGSSVFAYSYWDNLQNDQQITVTAGQGVTLQVSAQATAPAGKVLVPSGVVMGPNDVNEIDLSYNVSLDKAAASALNLDVTSSNVQIGGSTTYASLVNITITPASTTVNDSNVLVSIVITLTEPADVTAYNAIIGQDITFDLTFLAS